VGVKLKWLLGFRVQCFETLPDHLPCPTRLLSAHCDGAGQLEVEADEMSSFVKKKANTSGWIAMDTRAAK